MLLLVIGLIVFLSIHLVPTNVELRNGLVARFGENGYKAFFAIVALIGFVLIVLGYHKLQLHPGKNPQVWYPPVWCRHLALALMLPAVIALVAAYVPSRIHTMLRHPMLVAIKLWALAHLLANGDLGSLLMFGSFLAFGVYDRISVKQRGALGPLGTKTGPAINDVIVVAGGIALYGIFVYWAHEFLIGVPVLT